MKVASLGGILKFGSVASMLQKAAPKPIARPVESRGYGGAGTFHAHRRTPKNLRRYWRRMKDD